MPKQLKNFGLLSLPYIVILAMAIFILLPQMMSGAFIPGVDSLFHMNRFYDTAMQIKTGHYSYFASVFGFNQTGRIVNALYGPAIAYFNGFILLLSGTWFRFEILDALIVLIIGGGGMYHLCRINKVKVGIALPVAGLYMLSTPIMVWVLDEQFTGWGAAVLPFVIMSGSHMVNHFNIRIIPLALAMTAILQTHLMSSVIGVTALIPLFLFAWIRSNQKIKMIFHLIIAAGLTLLLTGNVWGGMLEAFYHNNLIPVFPQTNMRLNAVGITSNRMIDRISFVYLFVFLIVLVYLLLYWKKTSYQIKAFTISGLLLLFISSKLFPWNQLANRFPSITYTIQMPKRFIVVAVILLLLSLGMILSHTSFKLENSQLDTTVKVLILLIMLFVGWRNVNGQLEHRIANYYSNHVISQPIWLLHYHSDDANQIRDSYHSKNLELGLNMITKATPDYLPTKQPVTADNYNDLHPYHLTNDQLIAQKRKVTKWVNDKGHLMVKWNNHQKKTALDSIPVVKYYHTEILVNGKRAKKYRLTKVGKVQVRSKPGINRLELIYHPSRYFKLLMLITMFTWLSLIVVIFVKVFFNGVKEI